MHGDEGVTLISARPVGDRSFGFAVAGVLAVLGALPLLDSHAPKGVLLYVSAGFIFVAGVCPGLLSHLNRTFVWVGGMLQKIISPFIVTVLFIFVITPLAVAKRLIEMPRGKRPRPQTYWVERELAVTPAFFRQQF